MWQESEDCELALSFQDQHGCEDVWRQIVQAAGLTVTFSTASAEGGEGDEQRATPAMESGNGVDKDSEPPSDLPPLPAPELG